MLASPISEGTFTTVLSNYVPSMMEKHLQFIDFNSGGDLFLGTSSLTTRLWTGSLWYYKAGIEPENINCDTCMTGVHTTTGVLDGRFLKDDLMVVGLDSGGIELVRLTREEDDEREEGEEGREVRYYLEEQSPVLEHDDLLTGLDTWSDGSLATVGGDQKLCVWDTNMALALSFSPAHSGLLTDLSCHLTDSRLVSTCSRSVDSSVRIWDTREARPARTLLSLEQGPSNISWVGEHCLVVGCLTGGLVMLDTRTGDILSEITNNNRPVYNSKLSPDSTRLAVCYDDAMVDVVKLSEGKLEVEMRESKHRDFVRGLAWADNTTLWSVGWDQATFKYKL